MQAYAPGRYIFLLQSRIYSILVERNAFGQPSEELWSNYPNIRPAFWSMYSIPSCGRKCDVYACIAVIHNMHVHATKDAVLSAFRIMRFGSRNCTVTMYIRTSKWTLCPIQSGSQDVTRTKFLSNLGRRNAR